MSRVKYDFNSTADEINEIPKSDTKKIDTSIRKIYDHSSYTDRIGCEWVVNLSDCIGFCLPNVLRYLDQITHIVVFATFQAHQDIVVRILTWILLLLACMCAGIRWYVSLRKVNFNEDKTVLQRAGLFFYIIPFFGIPLLFVHDLFTSTIKPIFCPKYLYTVQEPGMELAELEFQAVLEGFAESLVSCIISIILLVYMTEVNMLLILSIFFSISCVIRSVWIVRKKSTQYGVDWLKYLYMRIQFTELQMPHFLPHLEQLQQNTSKDVNYAGIQLTTNDVAALEGCIAPDAGEATAKDLERFQLSPFTLAKLSESSAFRLGSIFRDTEIQLFVVKLTSVDEFYDLYEEYCKSNQKEPLLYKHHFMHQIMFQTTGCVSGAVVRCEDIGPYLLKESAKPERQKIFKYFLRGLFGFEDEDLEVDSPEFLVQACASRNWRAMEFLLGENGSFDATFPIPKDDMLSCHWKNGFPLCDAVYNADEELLEFLVRRCKAKIDVEIQDDYEIYVSLLHVATEGGDKEIIQSLHDYGLDINRLDSLGRPPLFYCRTRKMYDFMLGLGALENVTGQTNDSSPLDNMCPTNLEQTDEISEICARVFVAIRASLGSQQHICPIVVTIAEYCCKCVTPDPSIANFFWPRFFRRCTRFLPYEVKSSKDLKSVVECWVNNAAIAECEYGHISQWNVSEVKNMDSLFRDEKEFNEDISGWNVSSVTSMERMFDGASSFNGDLSGWDVSNVKNMESMFNGASSFNSDLRGWDVSNVTNMGEIFDGASSFDQNLSPWAKRQKAEVTDDG